MTEVVKNKKKKILLIGDDVRFQSGIANSLRTIVLGTAHKYDYAIIGASINHPEKGRRLDLSDATNKEANINNANVILYPFDGYGSPDFIRYLIKEEKPDMLVMMTDPRYYIHLFQMENEIRKHIPITYISVWDGGGGSPLFNRPYYRSCDGLLCHSKQTVAITKVVLGEYAEDKIIKYFPLFADHNIFKPIDKNDEQIKNLKKELFKNKEYDFVLYFNSRNIRRKQIPDTMVAFRLFLDSLPKEQADRCCFVLHTQPVDENGTDLFVVRETLFGERMGQVIFDEKVSDLNRMNLLYNVADCTVLVSSNEGWGLSTTESVMAGTMIIVNVTGGLQDQVRFEDRNGDWVEFDEKFTTNNLGRYKNHGEWGIAVFPTSTSWQGSIPTPYVPDDRVDFRDVTKAIMQVYEMTPEERKRRGLKGREWMMSDEAMMSAESMSKNFINGVEEVFGKWEPRESYNIIPATHQPFKYLENPVSI